MRKRSAFGPFYAALEEVFGRERPWVVFDIGANDAGSGIAYARVFPRTEVHIFEAHPAVAKIARRRVSQAGLAHRAHVHEVAAYLTAAGFECRWSHAGKTHGDQLWIRRAGPAT